MPEKDTTPVAEQAETDTTTDTTDAAAPAAPPPEEPPAVPKTYTEEEYNAGLSSAVSESAALKAHLAAIKADADADSAEDVIMLASKLVTDDVSIDTAVLQVLEKYPQFKRAAPIPGAPNPSGGSTAETDPFTKGFTNK